MATATNIDLGRLTRTHKTHLSHHSKVHVTQQDEVRAALQAAKAASLRKTRWRNGQDSRTVMI